MTEINGAGGDPIANLILLGASPIFPDLLALARGAGRNVAVVTAPDQVDRRWAEDEAVITTDRIDGRACIDFLAARLGPGRCLTLSFGSRWLLGAEVRTAVLGGLVLNAHGARLPLDRGGGGFSWRIMNRDRIGVLLLHEVDDGIDTGAIVAFEEYVIPAAVRTPKQHRDDYITRLERFIGAFLTEVFERGTIPQRRPQPHYLSSYYPRLHTISHGWIDWSWPSIDIESFVQAFDEPYEGALTTWRGTIVHLKQCQLHGGEPGHHPFQSGLIIRNNGRWLVIALAGQFCLICEKILDEVGNDIIQIIKEGDRFVSPHEQLEAAGQSRVRYGPHGLR